MHVIVTDALPPITLATALGDELAARHPDLVQFFCGKSHERQPWSIHEHGCTPTEALRLAELGFVNDGQEPIGRALSTHLAGEQPGQRVWIAEMCSIFIGQDRTALLPLDNLNLQASESEKLSASAAALLRDPPSGVRIEPLESGRWRVYGNLPIDTLLPSPAALSYEDLGDWWPTGDAWRPWRRLVNELQMLWHAHPVNEARAQLDLAPVNGVWLYGAGAMTKAAKPTPAHWLEDLSESANHADWAVWLDRWQAVANALLAYPPDTRVTLTAPDRLVHLGHAPGSWWRALFRSSQQQQWRMWWQNSK